MRKCYYKKSFDIQLKKPYHKIFGPKRPALDGLPRNIAKLFVDFVGFHLSDVTNYSLMKIKLNPIEEKQLLHKLPSKIGKRKVLSSLYLE